MKIFVERIKKSIIFVPSQTTKKRSYMETKNNPIDIAAKQLWKQICDFSTLLHDNIHDDDSLHLYLDFNKKSSDLARYIDKHFYNDNE